MSIPSHTVAFITGHSVRGCTGLSLEQRRFQQISDIPLNRWQDCNYPYRQTFSFPEPFNVITGSCNNVGQFLLSRRAAFRQRHADAVAAVFARYDAVILIAGSCGTEILNNLELPADIRSRLHVFAYGPVSRRLPDTASLFVLQGRKDWLSRLFHPHADQRIDCSHMDYLRSPETLSLFNRFAHAALRYDQ